MTVWHARTERDALLVGLAATETGRSRDARSPLGGTRLHVLDLGQKAVVHLTGSDGARRGALYHLEAGRLVLPDLWCVLPRDAAARVARLAPQPVDLGSRGDLLVIAGRVDGAAVEIPITRAAAYRGIPCLPSARFTEVIPHRYWVIGGLAPATSAQLAAASALGGAVIDAAEIFEEPDDEPEALQPTSEPEPEPEPEPQPQPKPPAALPQAPGSSASLLLPGRPRAAAAPAAKPADPSRAHAAPDPRRREGT